MSTACRNQSEWRLVSCSPEGVSDGLVLRVLVKMALRRDPASGNSLDSPVKQIQIEGLVRPELPNSLESCPRGNLAGMGVF